MSYTISEIEQLVLTELDKAPLNTYCKAFEQYDGQFNVDDLKGLTKRLPACFVAWSGDRFSEVTTLVTYNVAMRISVIVAAQSLRGNFKAKDDDKGASQMADDVKTLLHKNNLGKSDIVGLELVGRQPLIVEPQLAVYGLDFQLEFID